MLCQCGNTDHVSVQKQDTKSPSVVGSLADRSKWQDLEDEEASWLAAAV